MVQSSRPKQGHGVVHVQIRWKNGVTGRKSRKTRKAQGCRCFDGLMFGGWDDDWWNRSICLAHRILWVDMSWLVSVTFLLVDWCAKVSVLCDRQLRSMGAILGILQQLGVFKRKGRELALGFECWAWRLPSKYLGISNYIFFRQFQSFLHHTLWHSVVSWPCSVEMEHWQSRPLSHLLGLTRLPSFSSFLNVFEV